MLIDFDALSCETYKNFKGGEKEVFVRASDDGACRIMKILIPVGASIGLHRHAPGSEIVYVISGEGKAVCNGKEERLSAGKCHYCANGSEHAIYNDGSADLRIFAVVNKL